MAFTGHKKEKGFTIVEMAIVIIILGLLIAGGGKIYVQYQKYQRVEGTKNNINDVNVALQTYLNNYGRYPCPAPLSVGRNDPDYGREDNCADRSVLPGASGTTASGVAGSYYVVNTIPDNGRTISYTNRTTDVETLNVVPRIRTGAVPFRSLGLDEDLAYDGYRRRLMYAVTENLTDRATFEPQDGGITLYNDSPTDQLTSIQDSAHYIVFSYGENEAGSYSYNGARIPCAAIGTEFEAENCNIDVDAAFQLAEKSTIGSGTPNHFDDVFAYSQGEIPLWELNNFGMDANVKNLGNVGIGAGASNAPGEEFTVDGVIRAQDDPATTGILEGKILSYNVCEDSSRPTPGCFPTSLFAGTLETPRIPNHGMECQNKHEFIVAIKNGQPVCEPVTFHCPGIKRMIGFNANGTINCDDPPPLGCKTEQRTLCAANDITLPASAEGTEVRRTAGNNTGNLRRQWYTCSGSTAESYGSWVEKSSEPLGVCSCTPAGPTDSLEYCGSRPTCGSRYSGGLKKFVTKEFTCPDAKWNVVSEDSSQCTCINSSSESSVSCISQNSQPRAGYNSGWIYYRNTHDCSASPPVCSGPLEYTRTCKCLSSVYRNKTTCPAGFPTPLQKYDWAKTGWECPDGESMPGQYYYFSRVIPDSDPESFKNKCQCLPDRDTRMVNCSDSLPGFTGQYEEQNILTCGADINQPGTWSGFHPTPGSIAASCKNAPIVCRLKFESATGSSSNSSTPIIGSVCTCPSDPGHREFCTASAGGPKSSCSCLPE